MNVERRGMVQQNKSTTLYSCVYFKCALNLTLLDEKVDVQHFINERSINLRFKVLG
jgi:hypothetical protein